MLDADIEKYTNLIIEKNIYNSVNQDFIKKLIEINEGLPNKIYIVGVDTDCCVLTIATSLFENDIRPIVMSYYCMSNGGYNSHEAGMLCMKRLIGERQIFRDEINSKDDLSKI
ncbi:isochorismatase family protein [Mycoplasma elephantis]|uniref:isochorismatase family protein n=1 Tax=Mycoplasma elephantis TaxID=114882 RepID=UPI000AB4A51C|nr:isochorismatase family protein [Mycoplasma elephantis]